MKTLKREALDKYHSLAVLAQRSDGDLETLGVLLCNESVMSPNVADTAADVAWSIVQIYRIQYGSDLRVILFTESDYYASVPLPDVIDCSDDEAPAWELYLVDDELETDEDEEGSWNWYFSVEGPSGCGLEEFGPYESKRAAYDGWDRVQDKGYHTLDGPYEGSKE